jgi:hypothetical protein
LKVASELHATSIVLETTEKQREGKTNEGYIGFDARFPNQNQTKHCWQNYVDYHKCILAKGEDFKPCRQVRQGRDARRGPD